MNVEPLTPANTTVVLVDHAVGFANVLRSHDLSTHLNNVLGLAKTAVGFQSGLVVTNGLPDKPSGPLHQELLEIIGDHPVIERPGSLNSFEDENFAAAVRATGRRKLAISGVSTEGCVLQTVLGALRADYEVYLVVDATASLTQETHQVAVQRMVQAGAIPVTWFSLAGEFHADHRNSTAPLFQQLMREHIPTMAKGVAHFFAAQQFV
ncbi:isochorismatase family protein [Lentzea sp. NPDC051213]|uniref:isochorismatase family protein n=1 Tax=Lentzea sp. NPDC051213 TaxID=3364126 RepID=UPI0037AA5889